MLENVTKFYGVETKGINEAGKNNPDKFPSDYMFGITNQEFDFLRSKFSKIRATPKGMALS